MGFYNYFPWVAQVIFFIGILPQIILNYKIKTADGLSDFLLLGYFNAYIFYSFYVFCLNLPLAHKTMIPLSLLAVLVLICQRIYYSIESLFFISIFIFNFILSVILFPFIFNEKLGHISGWLMLIIWAIYQIPQLIKNFKLNSVQGISMAWIVILGLGDLIEFTVAICLNFPVQTYLNNLRGILVALIFFYQFLIFKK